MASETEGLFAHRFPYHLSFSSSSSSAFLLLFYQLNRLVSLFPFIGVIQRNRHHNVGMILIKALTNSNCFESTACVRAIFFGLGVCVCGVCCCFSKRA